MFGFLPASGGFLSRGPPDLNNVAVGPPLLMLRLAKFQVSRSYPAVFDLVPDFEIVFAPITIRHCLAPLYPVDS